jgi:hypothetical protein
VTADVEYVGLVAIAKRLGCAVSTVERLRVHDGLLVYKKRLARVVVGGRPWAWATNDKLILTWQIAKCSTDRKENLSAPRRVRNAVAAVVPSASEEPR